MIAICREYCGMRLSGIMNRHLGLIFIFHLTLMGGEGHMRSINEDISIFCLLLILGKSLSLFYRSES